MKWLILTGILLLTGPVAASSTCYLYDGDAYWNCLREERADEQEREELREQIAQDTREALEEAGGEGAFE